MRVTLALTALVRFGCTWPTVQVRGLSSPKEIEKRADTLPAGYTVQYSTDRPGGDLAITAATSLADCTRICDVTNGCIGVSFNDPIAGPGVCFLKSVILFPAFNPISTVAYKAKATDLTKSTSSSQASTSSAAASKSSTASSSIATSSSSKAAVSSSSTTLSSVKATVSASVSVATTSSKASSSSSSSTAPSSSKSASTSSVAAAPSLSSSSSSVAPSSSKSASTSSIVAAPASSSSSSYATPSTSMSASAPSTSSANASPTTSSSIISAPMSSSIAAPSASSSTSSSSMVAPVTTSTTASTSPSTSASSTGGYTVETNTDHPGGDLSAAYGNNFTDCQTICDATAQCIGYAYVGDASGGTCYLKQAISNAQANPNVSFAYKSSPTTASTSIQTSSGATQATSAASQVSSGSGAYTTESGTDHPGGDLSAAHGNNFTDCQSICDATPQCVGYAYVGDASGGTCYLKSALMPSQPNPNVQFAYKSSSTVATSSAQATFTQAVASAASSASATSSTSAASAPSASVSGSTSCALAAGSDGTYTDSNGSIYDVECGTDHVGGDSIAQSASSFVACMGICDGISECVGFAYVGGSGAGTCYFKSSIVASNQNANVDFAYKPSS